MARQHSIDDPPTLMDDGGGVVPDTRPEGPSLLGDTVMEPFLGADRAQVRAGSQPPPKTPQVVPYPFAHPDAARAYAPAPIAPAAAPPAYVEPGFFPDPSAPSAHAQPYLEPDPSYPRSPAPPLAPHPIPGPGNGCGPLAEARQPRRSAEPHPIQTWIDSPIPTTPPRTAYRPPTADQVRPASAPPPLSPGASGAKRALHKAVMMPAVSMSAARPVPDDSRTIPMPARGADSVVPASNGVRVDALIRPAIELPSTRPVPDQSRTIPMEARGRAAPAPAPAPAEMSHFEQAATSAMPAMPAMAMAAVAPMGGAVAAPTVTMPEIHPDGRHPAGPVARPHLGGAASSRVHPGPVLVDATIPGNAPAPMTTSSAVGPSSASFAPPPATDGRGETSLPGACVGAALAALLGALLWGGFGFITGGLEMKYFAIVIGVMTGVGASLLGRGHDTALGILGAAFGLFGLLGGKVLFELLVQPELTLAQHIAYHSTVMDFIFYGATVVAGFTVAGTSRGGAVLDRVRRAVPFLGRV